ncbi:hypothetical protein KC929_02280 [Patescibacteria group bacterium]|nr:hypothetical protein [Patescibacteria group bacterium]
MKKNLLYFATVLIFAACKSSYVPPRVPNKDVTEKSLKAERIIPEKFVGTYVSFPNNAIFYQDSKVENEQGVDRGIFINVDRLSGRQLNQPMFVPVRYYKGPKKGKKVIITRGRNKGKPLLEHFLAPVVSVEATDSTYIDRLFVEIIADDFGDTFAFERTLVSSRNQGRASSGIHNLNRSKNANSINMKNLDARYVLECLRYQPGDDTTGLEVEASTGYYYLINEGLKYYLTQGSSGSLWFVDGNTKNHYIDMFYYMEATDNQKEVQEAKSLKIGY